MDSAETQRGDDLRNNDYNGFIIDNDDEDFNDSHNY